MSIVSEASEYFLSHAGADKALVREVATRLHLLGRETFFDEWSIGNGESIPGAIDSAIDRFEALVLFWSDAASESVWVRREFQAGVRVFIEDESRGFVAVRLDDTPLPNLVGDLKWIDGSDQDPNAVVDQLLEFRGNARLIAMQKAFSEMDLGIRYFEGYGVAVACPRCGNPAKNLEGFSFTDDRRDDTYAGARCPSCKWQDADLLW